MIRHNFHCNICSCSLPFHPAYGADCLTLFRRGPIGDECSVLVEGDYISAPTHSEVHICRQCEAGLSKFFTERKQA